MLEPTRSSERIAMLDSMRGIAVLGILLLNIVGFGLPNAYDDPTNWGGAAGADLIAWRTMALFFEGAMRGLFTLLFGASALLFLDRHVARSGGRSPTSLYFRRSLWLIGFGLLNGYVFLWDGDILFFYGVTGLLLFVFRNFTPRQLIGCAVAVLAVQSLISVVEWNDYRQIRDDAGGARASLATGRTLSAAESHALAQLSAFEAELKPPLDTQEVMIERVQESYASAAAVIRERTWYVHTTFFFQHGLLDCLGMMLLGMALFKLAVLTGAAPTRVYAALALTGFALGLTVNLVEASRLESAAFSVEALTQSWLTYDLGRVPITLGYLGLIGLLCRSSASGLMNLFAAAGRMALTNYLAQSVICLFIFTGAGWALFGELQRHELYYIVAAIWAVQLVFSSLWLQYFRFGPAEWLWRSLTYWRLQPMRRDPARVRTSDASITRSRNL